MIGENRTAVLTPKAAADYIREHGWTQGRMQDATGQVCLAGAVNAVTDDPKYKFDHRRREGARLLLRERMLRFFPRASGVRDGSITMFNDARGRKLEQVLRVLDPQEAQA